MQILQLLFVVNLAMAAGLSMRPRSSPPAAAPTTCTSETLAYYHQGIKPMADGMWPDLGPLHNDGEVTGAVEASGGYVVFSGGQVNTGLTMGSVIAGSGGVGTYTVAVWFQYDGTDSQTYSALFGGRDATGATEFFIGKNIGNAALGVQDGNYLPGFVSNPGVFDASGRESAHSLIFTRSGPPGAYTGRVYLDGNLEATSTFTGVNSAEELFIGNEFEGSGYPFVGKIWQALILSEELDATQIASLHATLADGTPYCNPSPPQAPPACPDGPADLLAYYHQGIRPIANGVWPDLTKLHNDGIVSGNVSATGDHVVFRRGSVITGLTMGDLMAASGGSGTYTVAAWFQYEGSDSQTYSAVFGGHDAAGATEFFIGKNSGNTALGVQDGNYLGGFVSEPGVFNADGRKSAHSLIFTRSASPYTGRVYLDGALASTATFAGTNPAEDLFIGNEVEGDGHFFTGKIWQALILSTELDAEQAAGLHSTLADGSSYCRSKPAPPPPTSACPFRPNGLLAYYHQGIRPIADGVWPDLTPLHNDGTVIGKVSGSGNYAFFDGGSVNTGLTMGDVIAASGSAGAYTVAAWFQYTGTDSQTYSALFGGRDSAGATEFFVGKNAGNTALGVQDGNYFPDFVSSPGVFDADGRQSAHSLIFTRGGQPGSYAGRVYVDGALASSATSPRFTGVNEAEELFLGTEFEGSGYPFAGKIWQALILSEELDASQVSSLHFTLASGYNYCHP